MRWDSNPLSEATILQTAPALQLRRSPLRSRGRSPQTVLPPDANGRTFLLMVWIVSSTRHFLYGSVSEPFTHHFFQSGVNALAGDHCTSKHGRKDSNPRMPGLEAGAFAAWRRP